MISNISSNVFQLYFKEFGSCVYLIKLKNQNILIDTSSKENKDELIQDLKELSLEIDNINIIILTHSHWDHVGNIGLFKKAQIFDIKNIGKLNVPEFEILKTPGHTKDSICILYKDILFSGDTIFHDGGIGRTDFEDSDEKEMENSLTKLQKIKYKVLCPGHK